MSRDPNAAAPALADDALLAPFRESEAPVLTTREVSDAVTLGRETTAEALRRLCREGALERKRVGDETVWWYPGHTATEEAAEPMPGASREREGGLPSRLETQIASLDLSDERERAAVYAACYHLYEHGPTDPATLREAVYPDHPAGYGDERTWWAGCVRPALAAVPDVSRSDGVWEID